VCFTDLALEGSDTVSRSSAGMVFPHGLLVGMGPGLITITRTSSQSRGIFKNTETNMSIPITHFSEYAICNLLKMKCALLKTAWDELA